MLSSELEIYLKSLKDKYIVAAAVLVLFILRQPPKKVEYLPIPKNL